MARLHRRLLLVPTILAVVAGAAFLLLYRPDLPVATLNARYTNAESEFADVGDLRVHFRVEGDERDDKPTVVLLHGTGASLHTWAGWIPILSPDFTVVSVDLPGFGLTGRAPGDDYSLDAYLDFLDEFARELDLDSFHLVGNSLGGRIAWHYAITRPERVQRLVLIDASGFPRNDSAEPSAFVFNLARMPGARAALQYLTPRGLVRDTLLEVYGDPALLTEETVDRYFDLARRPGNRAAFIERAADARQDVQRDPAEITQPTLIMWGALDRWIPLADAHGFSATIPDSRLIVYPDVGHLPMEELPGPTARAVGTFLRP